MQLALDPFAPWAGFTAWFSGHPAGRPDDQAPAQPAARAPACSGPGAAGSPLRQLPAGGSLLLEQPQGVELVCLQGTLWVSQDDDGAEHIVVPGRPFVARHDGTLRVHAMSDSRCLLIAPHA